MNIKHIVVQALRAAIVSSEVDDTNPERAARWIESFNAELRRKFTSDSGYRVFSRGDPKELLYDITVIERFTDLSPKRKVELELPDKCLWQIESELEESNSRDLTDDLGKLALGAAENKIFVTSDTWSENHDKRDWLEKVASKVAQKSTGQFYLAYIPHPKDFLVKPVKATVKMWTEKAWKEI